MRIPLSSLNFDEELQPITKLRPIVLHRAIGQLLIKGQISLLYGDEKAPMTRLAHEVVVSLAKSNRVALFLDSGNNYSSQLVASKLPTKQKRNKILDNIIIAKVLSLSDLSDLSKEIRRIENLSCICLDSLSQLLNLSGAPGSISRQRELFKSLTIIRRLVNTTDVHFLTTSYSTQDWNSGDRRPIGGNVLDHNLDSIIRIDRIDQNKGLLQLTIERSPRPIFQDVFALKMSKSGFKTIT